MDGSKYQLMAQLCVEKYQSLNKTGKPLDSQWTTLCGLICEQSDSFRVVCLATGTKCVTGTPSRLTNVLIDCHAEVLCKRAFKQHLMGLIDRLGCNLNHLDNLKWHLFISQLPCGTIDRYQGPSRQGANQGISRKPGRGEPCLDASCIDKILKWNILGIQGKRLISLTRKPIRLKSLIVGNCVEIKEFDQEKVEQALTLNTDQESASSLSPIFSIPFDAQRPGIHFVETIKCSPFIRYNHLQACPSAIV